MLLSNRFRADKKPHINLTKIQKQFIRNFIDILKKNENDNFEKLNCLICEKNDFEIISEKDRYGLDYSTGICSNCGNMQQTKYFSDYILNLFYKEYYNNIYFNFANVENRFNSQKKLAINKYSFLEDFINNSNKNFNILEIGCGPGGILSFFSDKGFDVTGIDLDDNHLEFGRKKNLNLINRHNFNVKKKYDLILISHVLEHLKKPEIELNFIKKYSHENTIIYIEVPSISMIGNMYDFDVLKYLHIAHCYHFSSNSFKNFCIKNGLNILKVNSKIQALCSFNEKKTLFKYNYSETKKELEKFEKVYSKYGKILILVRIIRRAIGSILNLLGLKSFVLKILDLKN